MTKHIKELFLIPEARSVGFIFFTLGFMFSTWANCIPYIKEKFALTDDVIGLLLLCMPIGIVLITPFIAGILSRVGLVKTMVWSGIALCIAYFIPPQLPHIGLIALSLVAAGAIASVTNVSMNTGIINIQQERNIQILAACHGLFSIGLMIGAIMGSSFIPILGISIYPILVSGVFALVIFLLRNQIGKTPTALSSSKNTEQSKNFVWPTGILLLVVVISFATNLIEGSMADWATVYMKDVVNSKPFKWGWGLTAYSFFMALGRLFGDNIISRYGGKNVLINSAYFVAIGVLGLIFVPHEVYSLIFFAVVGGGISCMAPILYGEAANAPNLKEGVGLATVNSFSMFGFLVGPVLIGFLSSKYGLQNAFFLVLFCVFIEWILAMQLKPQST